MKTPHAIPSGAPWMAEGIADTVGRKVIEGLERIGRSAIVKSVRFLPSTSVELRDGNVEVIANTTITTVNGTPGHPETFESVVTIDEGRAASSRVASVSTHALDRLVASH